MARCDDNIDDLLDSKRSTNKGDPSDFLDVICGVGNAVKFKVSFFIFIVYLLLASDVFRDRILVRFDGAVSMGAASTYGSIVSGIFLVLFYVLITVLIENNVL